jgi:hypothetical protein
MNKNYMTGNNFRKPHLSRGSKLEDKDLIKLELIKSQCFVDKQTSKRNEIK